MGYMCILHTYIFERVRYNACMLIRQEHGVNVSCYIQPFGKRVSPQHLLSVNPDLPDHLPTNKTLGASLMKAFNAAQHLEALSRFYQGNLFS